MAATVWTPIRKWMGNFVPLLFWLPFTVLGLARMLETHQLLGSGLWYLMGATAVGWVALNYFGLFQNGAMRRRLSVLLNSDSDLPAEKFFVGFSSPSYTGILDAHEDVGFLCLTDKSLVFVSENRTVEMLREQVQRVLLRPNPHTLVGLGGWISIEGETNGKPIRMLIEPREKPSMLGNALLRKGLRAKILRWVGASDGP